MKPYRDQRLLGIVITITAVVVLGVGISLLPGPQPEQVGEAQSLVVADGRTEPNQHARDARSREVELRFQQAIAMLHAKQYEYAAKALHRVLELSPELVEAHVNMGYALIGLENHKAAHDFFAGAIALRPEQVNAYYGLAMALEGMDDIRGALGAMRTFIHLSDKEDPYLRKARSALWVWEAKLSPEKKESSMLQGDGDVSK